MAFIEKEKNYRPLKFKKDKSERGYIPKKVREKVLLKFNGRCCYCGEFHKRLFIDHVIPVYNGGTDDEYNLMPACFQCNSFKGAFSLEEFRHELSMQVVRAFRYSVNFRMAKKYMQVIETQSPIVFYFERVK